MGIRKKIFTAILLLSFSFSVKAQQKIKLFLGIQYMKDTVTVLYNRDTLYHGIVESNFNAHTTQGIEFIRNKRLDEFLQVHINRIKVAVSLRDYTKLKMLRIDCIPNPQNITDKEVRIYKVK